MLDEAFHPAEALGEREQPAVLERAACRLEAATQLRGDDAAVAAGHLSPRERVLRVAGKSRVMHALDARMLLEELRDRERVGAMPLHAQCQRLDAAQRQERVERPG